MNTEQLFSRTSPSDIAVERAVLGIMLIEGTAVPRAIEQLRITDFLKEHHRIIFSSMCDLFEKERGIDVLTTVDALRADGKLEEIGGAAYLVGMMEEATVSTQMPEYIRILIEKSILRDSIRVGTEIISASYDASEEASLILQSAETKLFQLIERRTPVSVQSVGDAMKATLETLDAATSRSDMSQLTGIQTGFRELDRLTSGWQKSDLILLAARPSMGKTALALNLARTAAMQDGKTVLVMSLEMARLQLTQRLLAMEAKVESGRIRGGSVDPRDWVRINEAQARLAEAGIYVDDTSSLTPIELRAKARKFRYEYGVDLIIVDYLQLMRTHRMENRQQEVSEISRSMKALARDLEIPVIALSQLSRAVETREKKEPMLSDLRESGSLEQDADVVLFLYRPSVYGILEEQNSAEIIIGKQRNGPIGRVNVVYLPEYSSFEEVSGREQEIREPEWTQSDVSED